MTVYLDIVFLENIVLNYIILLSTGIISKSQISIKRIFFSSIIGGIFAILNYIIKFNFIFSIIIKVILSIIMVKVAFKSKRKSKIIRNLIFFYLVSFTFGGIAFMLLFVVKPENIIINNNHFVGTYPLKIAVFAGVIGFIIISLTSKIIKDRINKKSMICDLEIFFSGKNKKIKTMLDTGNLLKEPISGADVIIVEKDSLEDMVSDEILKNITKIIEGKWISESNVHSYKFKLIPFSSLGNDNGLLIGFKPDYIKIYREEEYLRDDVIIAIYDGRLSKTNMYTSLIGLNIINNSKQEEVI